MEITENIQAADLKQLIETKQITKLRELFEDHNVVDMSELVGELEPQEALFLFKTLKKDQTSEDRKSVV